MKLFPEGEEFYEEQVEVSFYLYQGETSDASADSSAASTRVISLDIGG